MTCVPSHSQPASRRACTSHTSAFRSSPTSRHTGERRAKRQERQKIRRSADRDREEGDAVHAFSGPAAAGSAMKQNVQSTYV